MHSSSVGRAVALALIYLALVVVGVVVLDSLPIALRATGIAIALLSTIGFVAALFPRGRRARIAAFLVLALAVFLVLALLLHFAPRPSSKSSPGANGQGFTQRPREGQPQNEKPRTAPSR